MQLKNKVFLTFDIDWASDEMMNSLIDLCVEKKIKATFFATHESKTLERLRSYGDQFEIGLHPNFMPGSSQGETEKEVLEYCKQLVPDVVSVRPHCLYQYGRLYTEFNRYLGDKIVESSVFMPGIRDIQPFELHTSEGSLIRVPFLWADDYYLLGKQILNPVKLLKSHGAKIYMFHPVHLFYNTSSLEEYEKIKQGQISGQESYQKDGIATLFTQLVKAAEGDFEWGLMKEFLRHDT